MPSPWQAAKRKAVQHEAASQAAQRRTIRHRMEGGQPVLGELAGRPDPSSALRHHTQDRRGVESPHRRRVLVRQLVQRDQEIHLLGCPARGETFVRQMRRNGDKTEHAIRLRTYRPTRPPWPTGCKASLLRLTHYQPPRRTTWQTLSPRSATSEPRSSTPFP